MQIAMRYAATLAVIATLPCAASAQGNKEFRYQVRPGSSISIVNEFGAISVRPASGSQVLVNAFPHSNKVEVDASQSGNRIEVRSHFLQKASPADGRVEYEVQVPADADVSIRAGGGPVVVEKVNGDLTVESETARVEVRDVGSGHLHIKTLDGPVTLTNVHDGYVEVTSAGGDVMMTSVSGRKVAVNTTKARISYVGDFGGGGDYSLSSGSGTIDVSLPASASVSITARSVAGNVEDGFQFQPSKHPSFVPAEGKSFSGTANSGAASVRLRSFSGNIRVRKQ